MRLKRRSAAQTSSAPLFPPLHKPPSQRVCLPSLEDGQVIFLSPGTFGSYLIYKDLRERGCKKEIAIGETGTLPYLTRKINSGECRIVVRACHLADRVFSLPGRPKRPLKKSRAFFPSVHPVEDALSAALMNAGPIIHPPLVVLNTGPVESPAPYDIHNEGTTPGHQENHFPAGSGENRCKRSPGLSTQPLPAGGLL